ncbi:MAG: hypothetical protein ACI88A_002736 [Paraglaciecola sp.]|jgi:hypothetical protein
MAIKVKKVGLPAIPKLYQIMSYIMPRWIRLVISPATLLKSFSNSRATMDYVA